MKNIRTLICDGDHHLDIRGVSIRHRRRLHLLSAATVASASLLLPPPPPPPPAERTPLLSDSPATVDELGRKPLADALAAQSPSTMLLAAGGIADGRGLVAARMLGADGVLMGTRLWASAESLASAGAVAVALKANGDETARSAVFDVLRRKAWPPEFDFRALRNRLHRQWGSRMDALRAAPEAARADYDAGVAMQDFDRALISRGQINASAVGAFLATHRMLPQLVLVSPSARTRDRTSPRRPSAVGQVPDESPQAAESGRRLKRQGPSGSASPAGRKVQHKKDRDRPHKKRQPGPMPNPAPGYRFWVIF